MGPQLADLAAQGQIKYESIHFPLRTESTWAVEAVECAGEQGYWWAMHGHILENQAKGVSTSLMKDYAKQMGLDTAAFNKCMDSDKYVSLAKESRTAGEKAGVQGTPTFLLNGKPLNISAFPDVVTAIKKELSK